MVEQQIKKQQRPFPWKRTLLLASALMLLIVGVVVGILNIQGIIQGNWSAILGGLLIPAVGLVLALYPLLPFSSEDTSPKKAMVLPLAAELLRKNFKMGDPIAANFPYIVAPVRDVFQAAQEAVLAASRGEISNGLLILGRINAGKTRLAFEVASQCLPDWPVLTWRPGNTVEDIPTLEKSRTLLIFIDDLQEYVVPQTSPGQANSGQVDTLRDMLRRVRDQVRRAVIVATCRLGDERRVSVMLSSLFEELTVLTIPDFDPDADNPQSARIIAAFQGEDRSHVQRDAWDGTIGSLVLGLRRKETEYQKLVVASNSYYGTVLHAMKLLWEAYIVDQTEERVRQVCAEVFAEPALLENTWLWRETVDQLEKSEFVTVERRDAHGIASLVILKDSYFDEVIRGYPGQPYRLDQDLVKLHQALMKLKDAYGLLSLAAKLNYPAMYDESLAIYKDILQLSLEESDDSWSLRTITWNSIAALWFRKGAILADQGKMDALERWDAHILTECEAALLLDPDLGALWSIKGEILRLSYRYKDALAPYDRSVELLKADRRLSSEQVDIQLEIAYNGQGFCLSALKLYPEALKAYEEHLRINPKSVDAWRGKAAVYSDLQEYEQAVEACTEAIKHGPDEVDAYLDKAKALEALGDSEKAVATYHALLEAHLPEDDTWRMKALIWNSIAGIRFEQGNALEKQGKLDELAALDAQFLEECEAALVVEPGLATLWNIKGQILRLCGRYNEALDAYNRVIGLLAINKGLPSAGVNVELGIAWSGKAESLRHSWQYQEALEAYEELLKLNPDNAEALAGKREMQALFMKYEAALPDYEEGIKGHPNDPDIYLDKAEALEALGRSDEAVATYHALLKLPLPGDEGWRMKTLSWSAIVAIWFNKAAALEAQHKVKELNEWYEQILSESKAALASEPDLGTLWRIKGEILRLSNHLQEAIDVYARAIALLKADHRLPSSLTRIQLEIVYNGQGESLFSLNRYSEALMAYEECLKVSPNNIEAWRGKGKSLIVLEEYEQAVVAYAELIKRLPDDEDAYLNKAEVLQGLGRSEEALLTYQAVLKLPLVGNQGWSIKAQVWSAIAGIRFEQGNALEKQGKLDELAALDAQFLEECEAALVIEPKLGTLWNIKGQILRFGGRYNEALDAYDRAINLLSTDKQLPIGGAKAELEIAWSDKAICLERLGWAREAAMARKEAQKLK